MTRALANRAGRHWGAVALLAALALAGCGSTPPKPVAKSYVVLLSEADGSTGEIALSTSQGITRLSQPLQAARFADPAGQTFALTPEQLQKDFAQALAASPQRHVSYLLKFEAGGAKLSPESEVDLARLLEQVAQRAAPDVSVIGHTDTVGDETANEKLGLVRARFVADLILASKRVPADRVMVESHGEKNPLVATPDNTAEPRNRRVEVTVR